MVATMPPGSAISLPVDWLRQQLETAEMVHGGTPGGAPALDDLTVESAGKQLGRSASTLRTWCAAGLIPGAYRLRGREWRIPPAALQAMLDREAEKKTDIAPRQAEGQGQDRRLAEARGPRGIGEQTR
jgi:excisionase family DNA binding protein